MGIKLFVFFGRYVGSVAQHMYRSMAQHMYRSMAQHMYRSMAQHMYRSPEFWNLHQTKGLHQLFEPSDYRVDQFLQQKLAYVHKTTYQTAWPAWAYRARGQLLLHCLLHVSALSQTIFTHDRKKNLTNLIRKILISSFTTVLYFPL